jgi:uncharacterized protein
MDKAAVIEIADRYIGFLIKEKNINVKRAFLFGSYARNDHQKDSDIDLALIIRNISDRLDMQLQLMIFRRNFDLSIEPHPFDEQDFNYSNPFAYEIMNHGIEINLSKHHS